jgi:hypothetical protein
MTAVLMLLCANAAQARAAKPRWHEVKTVKDAVDLAGPRSDGRLVVATTSNPPLNPLFLYRPGAGLAPFARGPRGYSTTSGEGYLDIASGRRIRYADCSFGRDVVYAIDQTTLGIIRVSRAGVASRFADLPPGFALTGITFDRVGSFGYRLLVTAVAPGSTTVYGFDCRGRRRVFAQGMFGVEGGIRVAPPEFGRFGGDLIMPNELTGNVYAANARGRTRLMLNAGTPAGPDIGIESLGFAPPSFERRRFTAYVSSAHGGVNFGPGTQAILSLGTSALRRIGVRPGDLLGASELAGTTVLIRCGKRCSARTVARAGSAAHIEGHIVFAPTP